MRAAQLRREDHGLSINEVSHKAYFDKKGRSDVPRSHHMNDMHYAKWRNDVFARDGFICQSCFRKGTVLNAHHILSWATYSSERYNVDNGISLCKDCHMETHRKHQSGLHGSFTSEAG